MIGVCLGTAFALAQATLPTRDFTLAWTHSVEKTRWEEHYRVEGGRLRVVGARIEGSGAGMEPPADAVYRNGGWDYRPHVAPLAKLTLANSDYTGDYTVCWGGHCVPLARLLAGRHGPVDLYPCRVSTTG
jgi:hypothetical protein